VHVVFEAEGTSGPLDSPSKLFVRDEDSEQPVLVDGAPLPKHARVQVRPGAVLSLGGVLYQIQRDVHAHA
jgi:hypothetical protein